MKRLRKHHLLIGGITVVLLVVAYLAFRPRVEDPVLSFPDTSMYYEIASTPLQQERGLSGRKEISDNYGMLFVFPKKERYGFWMKDMLISIDIMWLADDGTILKIDEGVTPLTYPTAYYPPEPVRYVLETRSGFSREHSWQVGTRVPLPSSYLISDK